jgi:NADPH-dependent ferric siderophore reductase
MPNIHEIVKVRHEIVVRALQVRAVADITPHMRRVTLGGAELVGFNSPAADDHVKLFFPVPGTAADKPAMPVLGDKAPKHFEGLSKGRDYTPRRHDATAWELDIDFVLHGDGPASTWAANAEPGHWLVMGGPKGSRIVPDDFDNYILIGDETALPAIGRRLEELRTDANVITVVEVADAKEQQPLTSKARVERLWVHRKGKPAGESTGLLEAVRELRFPPGDTFVWVAAESRIVRGIRKHLEDERRHDEDWTKTSGYWKLDEDDDD